MMATQKNQWRLAEGSSKQGHEGLEGVWQMKIWEEGNSSRKDHMMEKPWACVDLSNKTFWNDRNAHIYTVQYGRH